MLKQLLFVLCATIATAAIAAPHNPFARDLGDEPMPISAPRLQAFAAADCAIQIRYASSAPAGLTILHQGGECDAGEDVAIAAAAAAAPKVAIGGEPAAPVVYECAISVLYDLATPSSVSLIYVGAPSCDATRATALLFAVPAIRCMHHNEPCRP